VRGGAIAARGPKTEQGRVWESKDDKYYLAAYMLRGCLKSRAKGKQEVEGKFGLVPVNGCFNQKSKGERKVSSFG